MYAVSIWTSEFCSVRGTKRQEQPICIVGRCCLRLLALHGRIRVYFFNFILYNYYVHRAVSSLSYHCMRQKTRLTDIGWTSELLSPQRTGALKGAVLCDIWGSDLKQWALYHYIASLGDGTADADGWLKMTVVSNTLLRGQSTSQKGQSLPFLLVAGRSNGCLYIWVKPKIGVTSHKISVPRT